MTESNISKYCKGLREKHDLNGKTLLIKVPQTNLVPDPSRNGQVLFNSKIALSRGYQAYLPTGLQCLADTIEGNGIETRILDMNYELLKKVHENPGYDISQWLDIMEGLLESYQPSVVGVANTFTMAHSNFLEVLKAIRSSDIDPIIIVGGQNATYEAQNLLNERLCDFVCEREGENKLNYIFNQLYQTGNSREVSGIQFKSGEEIERTEGPRDVVILKGNLINQHKKMPIEDYSSIGTFGPFSRMAGEDVLSAPIVFNRGCRGNCSFCTVRDYIGKGVRGREVKEVLEEIDYLYSRGIRHIEFLDDDLTKDKERLEDLLNGLSKRDLSWSAQNGLIAYDLKENILGKMRESGCVGFKIGVESGNPEILKQIRKPGTLDSFRKFAKRAEKFPELFISFNYIFGFPKETFGQIMNTFDFSKELNSDWCSYSTYIPLGTEKREEDSSKNFIPSKADRQMAIKSKEKVLEGYDIFNISPEQIPSGEQLKQIWFTLNMEKNFIKNKHLQPGGNPKKLASWMSVLQKSYPLNADFPFFLSLAYQLSGNTLEAERYIQKTNENLDDYWKERFDQFNLSKVLEKFPQTPGETRKTIESIVKQH
ncbi:MAG: B12-binding domain-containing radical SAM protein [Nanoarchaeota archaeon]|nr:B12-binding domain-containing radical SAM protein [Nanoarchaeota archaeon]